MLRADHDEFSRFADLEKVLRDGAPEPLSARRKAELGARIMASLSAQDQPRHWFPQSPLIPAAGAAAAAVVIAGAFVLRPAGTPATREAPLTAHVAGDSGQGSYPAETGETITAGEPTSLVLVATGATATLSPRASVRISGGDSVQLIAGSLTASGRSRIHGAGWSAALESTTSAAFVTGADTVTIAVTTGTLTVTAGGDVCTAVAGEIIDVVPGEGCAVRATLPDAAPSTTAGAPDLSDPGPSASSPAGKNSSDGKPAGSGQQDEPPGSSGSAPGQQPPPGNSGNAPGHQDPPGNSGDAPAPQDPPGNSSDAPGQQDPPGNSGSTPGQQDPPGNSSDAPGQQDPPGNAGSAPGQQDPPGNSGDAPGQQDPPGNSGDSPGQQDPPGNSGGNK